MNTSAEMWLELEARNDKRFGERRWHCDDIWESKAAPACVLAFLDVARAPAHGQGKVPALYATHDGKRVRVTMASRFGDVGITEKLSANCGYEKRLYLPELTDFSELA